MTKLTTDMTSETLSLVNLPRGYAGDDFFRRFPRLYVSHRADAAKINYENIRKQLGLTPEEVSRLDEVELARVQVNSSMAELGEKLVSKEAWNDALKLSENDHRLAMVNAIRAVEGQEPITKERWDRDILEATEAVRVEDERIVKMAQENIKRAARIKDRSVWVAIALVTFIFLGVAFFVFDGSSPSSSTPPTEASQAPEWYEGGTLHRATLAEWVSADDHNRLATAADFAAGILKRENHKLNDMSELLPNAVSLSRCINEAATQSSGDASKMAPDKWDALLRKLKVSEIAASCAVLMGW